MSTGEKRRKEDLLPVHQFQMVQRQTFHALSVLSAKQSDTAGAAHKRTPIQETVLKRSTPTALKKPGEKSCQRYGENFGKHPSLIVKIPKSLPARGMASHSQHPRQKPPRPECPHVPFQQERGKRGSRTAGSSFYGLFFCSFMFHIFVFSRPQTDIPWDKFPINRYTYISLKLHPLFI